MAKHSPEPWHVGGVGGCRPKLVYDAEGRTILRSWRFGEEEENDANVELAAQAPKLREQVRILREALERVSKECPDTPKLEDDPDLTLEERKSPDMVTVPREEREILDAFLSEWVLLQWAEDPRGDGDPAPHRKRIDELFERLDALRSGEDAK